MKLGLALSGGGIRGIAHAGVLKALEENNIKIDAIGGTSSGSIIATLYAMGYSPYYIYILFKKYAKDLVNQNSISKVTSIPPSKNLCLLYSHGLNTTGKLLLALIAFPMSILFIYSVFGLDFSGILLVIMYFLESCTSTVGITIGILMSDIFFTPFLNAILLNPFSISSPV